MVPIDYLISYNDDDMTQHEKTSCNKMSTTLKLHIFTITSNSICSKGANYQFFIKNLIRLFYISFSAYQFCFKLFVINLFQYFLNSHFQKVKCQSKGV